MTLRRLQTQAQEIIALKAEVEKLSTSCGHCGELEAAFERAEKVEADLARIRSDTIEECAQIADSQECPAIGHLIRALAQPEETRE